MTEDRFAPFETRIDEAAALATLREATAGAEDGGPGDAPAGPEAGAGAHPVLEAAGHHGPVRRVERIHGGEGEEGAEVAVVPGEAFGTPGYMRLSYATSDADIEEGVGRIAALLGEAR